MKIKFEKLGYIASGEIEPGKFTVICGKNNTGKTYISYAVYGLLNSWNRLSMFEPEFDSNNINIQYQSDIILTILEIILNIQKTKVLFLKKQTNIIILLQHGVKY